MDASSNEKRFSQGESPDHDHSEFKGEQSNDGNDKVEWNARQLIATASLSALWVGKVALYCLPWDFG
jgi:hypothetical protein